MTVNRISFLSRISRKMYLVPTLWTVLPAIIAFLFYYYVSRRYTYWLRKKVPHHKPTFIFGNYRSNMLLKKSLAEVVTDMCKEFPNEQYFGAYYGTEPALIVKDPALLKAILAKDFFYFNGREASLHSGKELLTRSLFFNAGDQWKVLRQNFTPIFSLAKMKNMFIIIENCSKVLEKLLEDEYDRLKIIDVRSLTARFTMDCIGNCAFGVDTNVMGDNPNNVFRAIGNDIFEISYIRGVINILRGVWPRIFYGLGFQLFPRKINGFFKTLILNVSNERKKSIQSYQNFVDLMFNFKDQQYVTGDSLNNLVSGKAETVKLEMSKDMIIAQCIGFFAAGYETSATTLTHTLYELAKRPDCQDKIIAEVDDYLRRHDNKLGYECISELPYMQACTAEAMRLYPILGVLTREVMTDYVFSNGLKLDKGVRIHIPVQYLHYQSEYFPEPQQYRPERFLGDERINIKPYTYMPFGEGPRICIGMRFAKMQMSAGLVTIFKKYRVKLASDMPSKLQQEPRAFLTQTKGEIRLEFIPRNDVVTPRFA